MADWSKSRTSEVEQVKTKNVMKHHEILRTHALFESSYGNRFYKFCIKSCQGDVEEKTVSVVAFLLHYNKVWYINSEDGRRAFNNLEKHLTDIYELINSTKPILDELNEFSLIKANLNDSFISSSIKTLYRRFSEILGATGASKALHLLLPKLIVMWDESIRKNYGIVKADDENYLTFLTKVRDEILDFLKHYASENDLSIEDAERELIEKTGVQLTKLIDEFNFLRYTKGELIAETERTDKDKIQKIMEIINEIVEGAYEASKVDWVIKGGYSDMVKASATKLKRIVEGYAKKGDLDGIVSYLFNVQRDNTGIRVSKILKACNKKTVEDVYSEIVRIAKYES